MYYGYDLRGLQTYARFDSTTGEGINTAYDGFGRMLSSSIVMDGATRTLSYQYDKNGNRLRVTHPDGQYFTSTYDGLNRQYDMYENGTASINSKRYNEVGGQTYDSRGAGFYQFRFYDTAWRVSGIDLKLPSATYDNYAAFTYNPASQLASRSNRNDAYAYTGEYDVDRTYAANGLNQYTSAGSATFLYDANGNLTSDGTSSYVYDVENRLIQASGPSSATLRYDPAGRLYETRAGTAASTTRMLYDGDELTAEYNTSGTMLRRYVHGAGSDDPLIWYEGAGVSAATRRHMFANYQGSITTVADSAGAGLAINKYDEWGIPAATNMGRFQYTGQAWLPEIGMYYYKARIYSPTLGRFMQTDPIGYKDQVNLYAYVGNDPINNTDPTGLECNKERTSCSADNALNSRAQDVRHNAQNDAAVVAAKKQFQSPTKQGGEPTGTVTGSMVTSAASKAGQTSTADTAKFSLGKADAGVHGHLGGSVTDVPKANGGYGDTQSLTQGKPMYTVEDNRVGVHDSPGGVMRFEMVSGKMTGSEAKAIQRNLDEAQKRFNRVGSPE